MGERDYESDMASLCDLINTHCRECGVVEASDYTLELMRAAVDRIVFKQQTEIERLRVYEVIAKSYHELPEQYHQGMLELLVKASFEAAEISHGRAAELLKCSIIDIREKGWVQGRKDEEIERLRALLLRWVRDADSGELDGVDLSLMAESEQAAREAAEGGGDGRP